MTVTSPRPSLARVTVTFLAPKARRLQPLGARAENAGEETDAREWPAPRARATQPADASALQTTGAPLLRGAMRTRRAFISCPKRAHRPPERRGTPQSKVGRREEGGSKMWLAGAGNLPVRLHFSLQLAFQRASLPGSKPASCDASRFPGGLPLFFGQLTCPECQSPAQGHPWQW